MFGKNLNGEAVSALQRRSYPEAQHEFLRCQLGLPVRENRRVGHIPFVAVELFHLLGYGPTWQEAEDMAALRISEFATGGRLDDRKGAGNRA